MSELRSELRRRCDTIEEAYEFMLAYAAQGLADDAGSPKGEHLRVLLDRAARALEGLAAAYLAVVRAERLEPADRYGRFLQILERDSGDALASVELVLAQTSISSQLVDNLNASIHLRALLTDLFLVDEIFKTARSGQHA